MLAAVVALGACGDHSKVLTLHAPEHRLMKSGQADAGSTVLCVTHGATIKGRVPAAASQQSSSVFDYDGQGGGSLSIAIEHGGIVTVTCS